MERLEPTRSLALRVWWAFIWRTCLSALVTSFLIGMIFGVFAMIVPIDPAALNGIEVVLAFPIAAGVSVEVMYRILKKRFADFEVALVRSEGGHG